MKILKLWRLRGGAFSRLRFLVAHNSYRIAENLIPEFERIIAEIQPTWWLSENVASSPLPRVEGYVSRGQLVKAVGNGVPLAMGRAIAQAVKRALA